MYDETKTAIKRVFEICRTLFFMGEGKFNELFQITLRVKPPTKNELDEKIGDGMSLEDAMISILRDKYQSAALSAGFTAEQGLAMLEYAALTEEVE